MNKSTSSAGKTKEKARTAHFRDDITDDGKTAYARLTNSNTNNTNTTTTSKKNNTTMNKKQKTDASKKTYKSVASTKKNNNTTLFATTPARNTVRIKNSRKATLARHKGKGSREGSAKEVSFAHKTRFDINFTLSAPTIDGRNDELQEGMDNILRIITNADNNAKLLPWKTTNQAFHPAIESSNETTASFVDIYLSRTWLGNLEKKHRAYFQIHLGHDEDYSDTILPEFEDFNSHSDRNLRHSMIQAEDTSFIGWFLYSTINIDLGGLSDAIYEVLGHEVGLRWMDIRMSNKGGKGKAKPVKAIHVEVEKQKSRKITEALMKHYGRSFESTDDFPLGIRLRFCKNIDSAAYPKERTKLIRLRSRQAQLLEETNKATSVGILDLDALLIPNEERNEDTITKASPVPLRTAIMAIQSKAVKNTPLFRSVDISYNSEDFVFAYHQSMAGEAKAMVDYLYPYLAHYFNVQSLKRAFDATHIKEMTAFKYNISKDRVEDTIAEEAYSIMENDNITGAIKFAAFDLSAMSIEDEETGDRPAASILGKMYGDTDSISTQHHGRHNKSTINTNAEVLEVTEEELMELQRRTLLHTQTKDKQSARKSTLHIHNVDTRTMLMQIRKEKTSTGKLPSHDDSTNMELDRIDKNETDNDQEESDEEEDEGKEEHSEEESVEDEDDNSTDDDEELRDSDQMEEVPLDEESTNINDHENLSKSAPNQAWISQSSLDSNFKPPTSSDEGDKGY